MRFSTFEGFAILVGWIVALSIHCAGALPAYAQAPSTGAEPKLRQLSFEPLPLGALPGTREEVEMLVQLYGEDAIARVGAEATEHAAKELSPKDLFCLRAVD